MRKKTVIVHSGGMDSSICLALALEKYGRENILSLSFDYGQRHKNELVQAAYICKEWEIDHTTLELHCLHQITEDALTNPSLKMDGNTLVVGRNGLFARLAAIHAHSLGANSITMGVLQLEEANSGYRDCSRHYMDLMEEILRIDLDNPSFTIETPIIDMTKKETMEVADNLGVLPFLLEHTITCYNGIPREGCGSCPSCLLRNQGIREFYGGKSRTFS